MTVCRSDIKSILGKVHLEAWHKKCIRRIHRKYHRNVSSRSFLFHVSPGKLAKGEELSTIYSNVYETCFWTPLMTLWLSWMDRFFASHMFQKIQNMVNHVSLTFRESALVLHKCKQGVRNKTCYLTFHSLSKFSLPSRRFGPYIFTTTTKEFMTSDVSNRSSRLGSLL